jgi:hypothetical protein
MGSAEKETALERSPATIVVSRDDLCVMTLSGPGSPFGNPRDLSQEPD